MECSSALCSVCKDLLDSPLWIDQGYSHHESLESFRKAVYQGCFICATLWKRCSDEFRDAWEGGFAHWLPMDLHLWAREADSTSPLTMNISFKDPIDLRFSNEARFWMVARDDKTYQKMFSNPYLEDSTSSGRTLEQIRKWCLSCRTNHKSCEQFVQQDPWCPTRLVDIGTADKTEWKLHFSKKGISARPQYITLSYRWGSDDDFKLTEVKLQSGFCGRIDDLPQTFKDAVLVARLFSIQYLWIDRLCIVQDSKNDWECESAEMRRVYANSFCNIAASTSTSPSGGLFRTRNPQDTRPGCVTVKNAGSGTIVYDIFDVDYLNHQVFNGPLHTRGWVFQERILAPRTIHFAEDQVFWECFAGFKCEAFPDGMPLCSSIKCDFDFLSSALSTSVSPQAPFDKNLFSLWTNLVERYTECQFTKESDKLIAFSGIAQLFQDITGDHYVAGLWRSHLVEHLNWLVWIAAPRPSSGYRAPSWSWASVSGRISMRYPKMNMQTHVKILDVQVQSSKPGSMGSISSGYIRLEGYVIEAICAPVKDRGFGRCILELGPHRVEGLLFPDALDEELTESRTITCLPLRDAETHHTTVHGNGRPSTTRYIDLTYFLVLETVCSRLNIYRRVAHLEIELEDWMKNSGFPVTEDGKATYSRDPKPSELTIIRDFLNF